MEQHNSLFLKGLNELRAIAALAVLFHHIELFKARDGLPFSLFRIGYLRFFINELGKNAVYLFFVLSGFLITYLIIKEKEKYQFFDFKKFYVRRILRIWPLYYMIMLISFFIIPFLDHQFSLFKLSEHYHTLIDTTDYFSLKTIISYWCFLSNYGLNQGIAIVGASQSWSVSIEEQFYVFWPVLLLLVFRKNKLFWVALLTVLIIAGNYFFHHKLLSTFRFEYLFIGCLGALFVQTPYFQKWRERINHRFFYVVTIGVILLLLFIPVFNHYVQTVVLSLFFLILIVLTVNNTIYFRSTIFSELGKISYGIYMYHPFVLFLVFPLVDKYVGNKIIFNLIIYLSIPLVTLIISYLSYHYIEKKFLKLKEKKFSKL